MEPRISAVKNININSIVLSSVFQIGDINIINPRTKVIAVQREIPVFRIDETDDIAYPIFSRPIPKPIPTEPINIRRINKVPIIEVNNINVSGISTSGICQIGSNKIIDSEARIKHIRHIIRY